MSYTNGLDKPSNYFNTVIYSGSSSNQTISGVGFQSDMTWFKNRNNTANHALQNSVVGAGKRLSPDRTVAEGDEPNGLGAWNSDGFTFQGDYSGSGYNASGRTYVAWNWKAGTSFTNDASSTGIGTIDSNGSVSSTAGFGIVKWSGTGSAGTIAHNMGSTPSYLIIKRLSEANWLVQTTALGYGNYLALNTTDASASASTLVTGVSSTLVTLGNNGSVNGSGQDYIGYFFSEKQGYSKFGSYTGNGNADGTFVYTGFKPAFVLCKNTGNGGAQWLMVDNKRVGINPIENYLQSNSSSAEGSDTANFDFLSNGFKCRSTNSWSNQSGYNIIYMAFSENPFTTSSGIPACAR